MFDTTTKTRIAAAAATMSSVLFTLGAAPAPAHATPFDQPAYGERTIRIATDGLDLRSAHGVGLLERRIKVAAARVCSPQVTEPLPAVGKRKRCYAAALADGLRQMDRVVASLGAASAWSHSSVAAPVRPALAD